MILVDSTVWIDLFRKQPTAPTAILERLLEWGEAAVTPVIIQEILQGASDAQSLERLRTHLLPLPLLESRSEAATHVAAAELYARCRWAGMTPRSPHDCLIAVIAVEHGVSLLHDDRDFEYLARMEPDLRLIARQ
ncbi:PIN domain-containing protein [Acidiferrobacter sp.]|uniref:type II toxin-antitoxin system VapC family toxin n=1 Tax=Acidiferrobacter sp. TaxID=1872107 RepID=UPI0026237D63|nr:PIN domain-containing protein [Acidiferrobacter sp.]